MVINNSNNNVKFISYTGKYPNLCRGILTLEIDGVKVSFGHGAYYYKNDGNYEQFLHTGGSCGFSKQYTSFFMPSYCTHSEWIIDAQKLPEKYRKYVNEIDKVFNDNVEYGCCGGCL